jgi:hypothetical protein
MATIAMHPAPRDAMRAEAMQWLSVQLHWEHALDRLREPESATDRQAA